MIGFQVMPTSMLWTLNRAHRCTPVPGREIMRSCSYSCTTVLFRIMPASKAQRLWAYPLRKDSKNVLPVCSNTVPIRTNRITVAEHQSSWQRSRTVTMCSGSWKITLRVKPYTFGNEGKYEIFFCWTVEKWFTRV